MSHSHTPKPTIPTTVPRNHLLCKHSIVISLPQSKESRLTPYMESNKFDGDLEVITAIDGTTLEPNKRLKAGTYGCLLSHLRALWFAKEKGYPCVLITEDDARFVPGFTEKLNKAMLELPRNWDMLWLGGLDQKKPTPYSPLLNRLQATWGAYGYILRDTTYDLFIRLLNKRDKECDNVYKGEQTTLMAFKTVEPLVTHSSTQSDRSTINSMSSGYKSQLY